MKAIFFDIDGTLVPLHKDYVPASTMLALQELHEKGILLFICSGRPRTHIQRMPKQLLEIPWDGYVLFNGQCCCDRELNVFEEKWFAQDAMEALIPYIIENRIPCSIHEAEYAYMSFPTDKGMGPQMPVDDARRALTHRTYQMGAFIDPDMDDEFVSHAPGVKSARWTDVFADIIPADGGKPKGMEVMLKKYGLDRKECMAFGDGGNDITMLEYAGIGVAMGNANDTVKSHADYVTAHCEKDGILSALKHFEVL